MSVKQTLPNEGQFFDAWIVWHLSQPLTVHPSALHAYSARDDYKRLGMGWLSVSGPHRHQDWVGFPARPE